MDKFEEQHVFTEIMSDDESNPSKVAIFQNNYLVEFICKLGPNVPAIGSVHVAKICQVFTQHRLATGELENGILISIRLSKKKLCSGELVIVTVTSEPWQEKPPRAVLGAQLSGRYIILLPDNPDINRVSNRSILKDKSTQSLKKEISEQVPKNFGFIIRRQALKSQKKLIKNEIKILLSDWRNNAEFPIKLNLISKPKKLYSGISLNKRAQIIAPTAPFRVSSHLSDWHTVFEQLDEACDNKLLTKQQVVLWFQSTRGLTAIDIDSAGSKMAPTELSAHVSKVVMKQIRLRQISGVVCIDIPRTSRSDRIKFQQSCQDHALYDIRHPDIHGIGPAGLLEMTISHRHMPLEDRMTILKSIM